MCGGSAWYSFAGNDGYAECGYVNGYTKENIAPKTAGMNALNGMGRIRSYSTAENITVRGGAWRLGATAGLYALRADPSNVLTDAGIGFRCAK